MLTALVLVCSLAATPDLATCNADNAVDIMRIPELFANPAMCAMQAQAFLAQTAIAENLTENESVKVICVPNAVVDSATLRSVRSSGVLTEKEISDAFLALDTDGNGQISRIEFEMNKSKVICPSPKASKTDLTFDETRMSRQAFDVADLDHDGTLSDLEIATVLQFETVDTDGKGYLVLEDLRRFMKRVGR